VKKHTDHPKKKNTEKKKGRDLAGKTEKREEGRGKKKFRFF